VYQPQDQVKYSIQVKDSVTGKPIKNDVYLTIIATDDSVTDEIRPFRQPMSLTTKVYFENEIQKTRDYLMSAEDYTRDFLYSTYPRLIDLLLGVQSWRRGIFDLQTLYALNATIGQLPEQQRAPIEALYAFVFPRPAMNVSNSTNGTNSTNTTNAPLTPTP
jgi:hypothetical protein